MFSKLTEYDFTGWCVYEWEDCIEHPEDAAPKGAAYIRDKIRRVTDKTFDDFAGAKGDVSGVRAILGLE